jgi:hypothetical protein
MEFVDSGSLASVIAKYGNLSEKLAAVYLKQVPIFHLYLSVSSHFNVCHLIYLTSLLIVSMLDVSSPHFLCLSFFLCLSHLVLTRYSRVSPTCTATTLCIAM